MLNIDSWYDIWRLGNLTMGIFCLIWLVGGLVRQHNEWNIKTRDLWYSRLMWAMAGCVLSVEGIFRGLNMTFSLVFITAATLVTGKALHRKGPWGYAGPQE